VKPPSIEPPRLLEEASSPVERALLEAGSSYRSSAAVHAKTLAAVGIAGTAAVAEVAGASLSNFGWSKWLTSLSVMGATAVIPAAYYVLKDQPETPVVQRAAPRLAPLAPPARPAEPEPVPLLAEAPAPAPRAEARPISRAPTLAEEIDAVDAARSALSRGDARSALFVLDAYGRVYPRGRLALEAEALRIDALDRSGQKDSARRRAEQFLRNHPKSVLSSRVRRFLGD